jgi:predicted nucleic acid-binding protein
VTYLIDTNVIAELRKGERANAHVRAWFQHLEPDAIALSVVTIGEIRRGIEGIRRRDEKGASALDRWLRGILRDHGSRVLGVDLAVAEQWGRFNVPDPLPVVDGLLAATAKIHGLVVATRNVKDIGRTGVAVVNPFEPEPHPRPPGRS